MHREIIGVDAGATWIKAARFRADLRELDRVTVRSGASDSRAAYLESILAAVRELGGQEAVLGIALPAVFSQDGEMVRYMAHVKGLELGSSGFRLAETLGEPLGITQVIGDNDANCAALGEWALGKGGSDPTLCLLHVTWGTGIGTGLVVGGVAQRGWEGGHLPFRQTKNGWMLMPGADLETDIAVPALVGRTRALFRAKTYSTSLTEEALADPTTVTVFLNEQAQAGDQLAQQVLREALSGLAWGLHVMAIMAFPSLVTVGGGMMSTDWLLQELRKQVGELGQGFLADSLPPDRVFRAVLGNDAGMIGAAMLARKTFL